MPFCYTGLSEIWIIAIDALKGSPLSQATISLIKGALWIDFRPQPHLPEVNVSLLRGNGCEFINDQGLLLKFWYSLGQQVDISLSHENTTFLPRRETYSL